MIDWSDQITLDGNQIKLIPLSYEYRDAMLSAAMDGELWNLWFTSVPSALTIDEYIETALQQYRNKTSIPFLVIDKKTNSVIGSTRFCNIDNINTRVEIGYTWYAKSYQKTGVNTECKLLLLSHAFEHFKAIAVEFRTHWFNHESRNAISRLGAKQDGILRNHQIGKDGCFRDTVVFSIIKSEWESVKKSLLFKIKSYQS